MPAETTTAGESVDTERAKVAVNASNSFGIELYQALGKGDTGNRFLSPYSMSIAMTMAAEGARGETEDQMATVLHFPAKAPGQPDGRSAITTVNAGYEALARQFREAAGNTDPATRSRIAELRKQLDAANDQSTKLERANKYREARQSSETAEKLATELKKLLTEVDRFDLRVANALWVEKTFSLVPAYVQTIDRYYGSGSVTPIDFIGGPEPARQRINTWVENNTEKRIKDLLPRGSVTPLTRLVITNAVYFKGQWAAPFDESSTKDEDFTLADGAKVKSKLMREAWRKDVPYAAFQSSGEYFATPREVPEDASKRPPVYPDDGGFTLIELPYKGGELSMVVIAPRKVNGLPAIESKLSAKTLDGWLKKLDRRTVDTAIPRFKLASEKDMSPLLQAMGMKRPFISPDQPGGAEFPGISSSDRLFISIVQHKAWVEVTEKGTEAAAATAIVMATPTEPADLPTMVPFIPEFRADRPFLFFIRDTKTGVILFMGRMVKPAA